MGGLLFCNCDEVTFWLRLPRRTCGVKKGWQAEQISRTMSPLWVERVSKWLPQAQRTLVFSYLGWMPSLGMVNPFVANPPQNGSLARAEIQLLASMGLSRCELGARLPGLQALGLF